MCAALENSRDHLGRRLTLQLSDCLLAEDRPGYDA